ncbi:NYN domain-containing protein [Methanococcoides orientis]|uniref:NYN domain-containing protein n=1 Tax=Methanococcoides orientis TaxID=2822137 RepID=UPI001E3F9E5A|nr:NYN domain-containing protein [Methanococcoides orientis]UGV41411.1 NYN domain-containing protein [Methanococcoides orientis]
MEKNESQNKLAVLIDADNAQASIVKGLFDEIAKYGVANVKRLYGDWTGPQLVPWKETLHTYSIQPIQQFCYTAKKNATDSALIIDAMDLLYTKDIDGFCIVSSDSDYTKLCQRLRESGSFVYGFGEKKTPEAFRAACNKFIYIENLRKEDDEGGGEKVATTNSTSSKKWSKNKLKGNTKLVNLLRSAIEDSANEEGWADLGNVGQNAMKRESDFDSRNYGYKKLSDLITAIDLFEINKQDLHDSGNNIQIYVRDSRANKKK